MKLIKLCWESYVNNLRNIRFADYRNSVRYLLTRTMNIRVNKPVKQQAETSSNINNRVLRIRDNGEKSAEKSNATTNASELMAKQSILL